MSLESFLKSLVSDHYSDFHPDVSITGFLDESYIYACRIFSRVTGLGPLLGFSSRCLWNLILNYFLSRYFWTIFSLRSFLVSSYGDGSYLYSRFWWIYRLTYWHCRFILSSTHCWSQALQYNGVIHQCVLFMIDFWRFWWGLYLSRYHRLGYMSQSALQYSTYWENVILTRLCGLYARGLYTRLW